ncbi:MAG: plastocyanin/azurin family copper-binding protein [Halobacteriales archaeon]|nr:plastocyanin/azurin family copper-binding protein [Halobacteriales archaeon]
MTQERRDERATTGVTRRGFVTAVAAGAGATATGCLGGSDASETEDALPDEVEVKMKSIPRQEFDPEIAHVAVGGTVRWVLESGRHDTTAYHPDVRDGASLRIPEAAEPWRSDPMSTVGETFEHTFEVEGVYDYLDTRAVCVRHETVGMVGRVVVGEPDLDSERAMEPPQEGMPRRAANDISELNERTREMFD